MRVMLVLTARRMTRVGVLVLLVASSASARTQTRVISWQPHTFGLVTKAGEGVRLSTVAEAVEIVGFTVGVVFDELLVR